MSLTTTTKVQQFIGGSPDGVTVTTGTFTCNGATNVTVTDANVTANSLIIIALKTVGGTVGAIPAVQTKTAGTGFTVKGTALDTSIYSYFIFEPAV